MYRLADQYAAKPKIMEFGVLNKESLIDLWNNKNYRTARRSVKNPAGIIEKEGIKEDFCIGCGRINESVNGYRWYRYATPNDPDDIFDLIQEERRKQEYDYQNLIPN